MVEFVTTDEVHTSICHEDTAWHTCSWIYGKVQTSGVLNNQYYIMQFLATVFFISF